MLSLVDIMNGTKGEPIAFISGGSMNGQIVYLHKKPPLEAQITEEEAYKLIGEKESGNKRLSKVELRVLNLLLHEKKITDKRIKEIVKQCEKDEKNNLGSSFKIKEPNCMLIPIPNINKRECYYISGCAGSGKSRFTAMYIRQWRKIFPEGMVYLFSDKEYDPAYDNIDLERVNIRDLVKNPQSINELNFNNALVIFDDIDTIMDPKMSKIVYGLQKKVLELCRQYNTYNININHLSNEGYKTKIFFNECDKYVFFPGFGNEQQLDYFLSKSIGLYKRAKEKIQSLEGWVIYSQRPPAQYFMNKDTILLKKDINEKTLLH